ncbi:MAG: succinoglycan biosynthesis protein [Tistrella sp.]|nr:succinoglycan biosynthesis protein [Tistrella sp.]MBA76628.1 succinoglycan biosynthesis protein [Tistrella sp.]
MVRPWVRFSLLCLLMVPWSGCAAAEQITGSARVIDGDTLSVDGTRIRLYGIDAPETKQSCLDEMQRRWACGREATQWLRSLVSGQTVVCDVLDQDRYGRVVGRCLVNGYDINRRMVADGMAVAYVNYSRDYVADQASAQAAGRGLWAGRFTMPWEYRRQSRPQ